MMKRLCAALAACFVLTSAHAAGTVSGFSLTPQFDQFGKVMPGCKLFVIQAGTTSTPQNAYQDSALTIPLSNPLTCDASGRIGAFFLADGLIKLRLTTGAGTQVFVGDNLLVIGPSSGGGGGGGGTVDPTTIFATGDLKLSFASTLTGWVRANGRTIGSATSGATERANADTQPLFNFLWPNTLLTVSGGRGANAAADFAANKTITLPDARGSALAGTDDMGAADSNRLAAGLLASCRLSIGCRGGEGVHQLVAAEIPDLTSRNASQSFSLGASVPSIPQGNSVLFNIISPTSTGANNFPYAGGGWSTFTNWNQLIQVTSLNTGGVSPSHNIVQPTLLSYIFMKL
jgi:hypothetical protein